MDRAFLSRTRLSLADIRRNLELVRTDASEELRGRPLLRCVDDATDLLDIAVAQCGDSNRLMDPRDATFRRRALHGIARRIRELIRPSERLDHPNARWEALSAFVTAMLAGAMLLAFLSNVRSYEQLGAVSDFLQGAEGLLTVVVILAAWSYSTWHFERTRRVERAIEAIDRCRSLILIIDAHALAKDFSRQWDPRRAGGHAVVDGLRRDEVIEYLAIGVRISKLTAQIAAGYGSVVQDHAVIAAIDSVSQLALSLERNAIAKQALIARGVGAPGAATATRAAGSGA